MTCNIHIQSVGEKFVIDMNVDEGGEQSHTAWKSDVETTLEDVLAALPGIYRKQMEKKDD